MHGLFEFEDLDEVVCAGVDDDKVLVSIDGDSLGRVDISGDGLVVGAVDRSPGVDIGRTVQQDATVALVRHDQVVGTVEAQAIRLVQLILAGASLSANSAHARTHGQLVSERNIPAVV